MAEGRPADGPPTPLSEVVADSDRPPEATIEPGLEPSSGGLMQQTGDVSLKP